MLSLVPVSFLSPPYPLHHKVLSPQNFLGPTAFKWQVISLLPLDVVLPTSPATSEIRLWFLHSGDLTLSEPPTPIASQP